jgi:lycopene beta-cyclase
MVVDADYALVGGGLQNGLIALAIRARHPAARIAMIERGAALGGNHTRCFHAADLDEGRAAWVAPLVVQRWPGYDVAFPAHARRLDSPYACITSARLAEVVTRALDAPGSQLFLRTTALDVAANQVTLRAADGTVRELRAGMVIDARGPGAASPRACGWQKFVGQELVLNRPHGLDRPMLMDATVPQLDGFRFVYVLPLAADRVLVEDTYFSNRPELDRGELRDHIAAYVAGRGWTVARVVREETGALPLPWECTPPSTLQPLVAGYAGGWFHPVTGYSFPVASRLAAVIAAHDPADGLAPALDAHARAHARQLRFAARLCRMLFHWFANDDRHRVLEWFYRLPEDLIRRFYALELTTRDRARILLHRPPRGLSLRGMLGMELA